MTSNIDSFQGNYRFLSNFYEHKFEHEGLVWHTAEHAYQAAKADNQFDRDKVVNARTAGEAKRIGGQVNLRYDWDDVKIDVMERILNSKFDSLEMKNLLLATGERCLIEGNTWGDKFWGICKGVGENNLGRLLMNLRSNLQHKNNPLDVKVEDGELIISIGVNRLAWAAQIEDDWPEDFYINDIDGFANDISDMLNTEEEDGSTLVYRMIDNAAQLAFDDGCLSVEEGNVQDGLDLVGGIMGLTGYKGEL